MHNAYLLHTSYAILALLICHRQDYIRLSKIDQNSIVWVSVMNLLRSFNKWRRYRTTYNELNRLSAHELNDLGISRSEIAAIARRTAR